MAVAIGVGAAVATTPAVAWANGPDGADGKTQQTDTEDKKGTDKGTDDTGSSGAKDGATTPPSKRPDPADVIRRSVERSLDNVRNAIAGAVRGSGGTDASDEDDPDEPLGAASETDSTLNTEGGNKNSPPAGFDRLKARSSKPALDEARTADVPSVQARLASADTAATPEPGSVLRDVRQSLSTLTKLPTNPLTTFERKPFLSAPKLPDPEGVQTGLVAPLDKVGKVLNAVVAPFFNGTPGEPTSPNPIVWAVLGWVRRQAEAAFVGDKDPAVATAVVDESGAVDETVEDDPRNGDLEQSWEAFEGGLGALPGVGVPINVLAAAIDGVQLGVAIVSSDWPDARDEVGDITGNLIAAAIGFAQIPGLTVLGEVIGDQVGKTVTFGLDELLG
ncbi:MAG: hypothetical protein ACSLE7_04835 [Mycobacterium sp.]